MPKEIVMFTPKEIFPFLVFVFFVGIMIGYAIK
jgi:hypothetical protein